jgi:hypothetical protein
MLALPKIHTHQYGGEDEEHMENFRSTRTCAFFPSIPQLHTELSWLQELK